MDSLKVGDLVVWHDSRWNVNQPEVGLIVETDGTVSDTMDARVLWSDGSLDLTWVGNLRLVKGMKAPG